MDLTHPSHGATTEDSPALVTVGEDLDVDLQVTNHRQPLSWYTSSVTITHDGQVISTEPLADQPYFLARDEVWNTVIESLPTNAPGVYGVEVRGDFDAECAEEPPASFRTDPAISSLGPLSSSGAQLFNDPCYPEAVGSFHWVVQEAPDVLVPEEPVVNQAVCDADSGEVSEPSLELPTTEGIEYSIDGQVAEGETIQVIAQAGEGTVLGEAEGWALNDEATEAVYEVTFEEVDCTAPPQVVIPQQPVVNQAVCDADSGEVSQPTLELPTTEGIEYTIEGQVAEGQTVQVIAAAGEGTVLGEAEGWALNDEATEAVYEVTFEEVDCTAPEPEEPEQPVEEEPEPEQPVEEEPVQPQQVTEQLERTGAPVLGLGALALALIASGAAASRRR